MTCRAIEQQMMASQFPRPTEDMWRDIALQFLEKWNFPNCLGAIDGKHITIVSPALSGSLFFNYKRSFSIVLLALQIYFCPGWRLWQNKQWWRIQWFCSWKSHGGQNFVCPCRLSVARIWCPRPNAIHHGGRCCIPTINIFDETFSREQNSKMEKNLQLQTVKGKDGCGMCLWHSVFQVAGTLHKDECKARECRLYSHCSMHPSQLPHNPFRKSAVA